MNKLILRLHKTRLLAATPLLCASRRPSKARFQLHHSPLTRPNPELAYYRSHQADYNPDQYLWEKDFTLAGRKYKREDLEASTGISYQKLSLRNERGHALRCSHYIPSQFPDDIPLPCVIYCHGNSGCRADANEAAVVLLPSNITLFTLDFSGSGLSDGDYVSLGWHEKNDLKVVVSYLRSNEKVSRIALWGRSMGAVTSLLYGAEDPSIAGMVLDSAFSNLFNLMMELADVYKIRLPKFTVKMAVQYMRRVIQKKAKFDIMRLDCIKVAPKTFIPALFGHAKDDKFIQPRHSDSIFKSYSGDKNFIKFDGDHNSSRPQFYYDSVSIFFYNVLHPPPPPSSFSTKIEKYYDLGDVKVGAGMEENILYEIIAGLRNVSADAPSSSSAPRSISATKSVGELLTDIAPDTLDIEDVEVHGNDTSNIQKTIKMLATPLRTSQQSTLSSPKDEDSKKKKNKAPKKSKREKFEKLEALSQRLRLCILKRVNHKRHCSS
ncbi:hypothetical protein BUALT_Bualt03G0096300 [Buddleja alternifolia]|uniref:Serine aminopeptidase S33 domain-containing protein n=1 Tax=Buddleja alternifolia TaxID=168488 RepID=A0AAV6XTL3_9LAMI|nr:hypothetical protein BUALT_Bualt03G0096300 [Buddleja alternifolia]